MVGLFGIGANDFETLCMLFESMEKAKKFCIDAFSDGGCEAMSDNTSFYVDGDDCLLSEIGHKFFTSYYGGCGEIYSYELREVEFETKLVRFSLD